MNSLITREHNGAAFTFREDGYFSMTMAARHFGKHLDDFLRNKETKEYIDALKLALAPAHSRDLEVMVAVPGNRYIADRGTWAHPKLAVFFARWLDVRFAVWCDMQIDETPSGGHLARMQG